MNSDNPESLREQLEQAIAAQESLRGSLDDSIIDTTIAALHQQLASLGPAEAVEQQRKLVTVLFMDVVDSTLLFHELDPEENMAIMDAALRRLAGPVEAWGGQVTRYMGDGFLAVFGLPAARENDPEMAVRAGLGILDTADAIADQLSVKRHISGFQVRVGVNTGLVVAGGVTEAEGTLMGTAVNLAARLESAAPPGGFLISQYTYHHVRGLFDLETIVPLQVKGFAEPVSAYRVKGARPQAFRVKARGVEGVEIPMIGRERELNQLLGEFEGGSQSRQSRLIMVVGEAGLGKSRLLEEFERHLERRAIPVTIFRARATLETMELPYTLLRALLGSRFGVLEDDPLEELRQKFTDGFLSVLVDDETAEMKSHFVGQLLGYDFRDSPYLARLMDSPQQLHDRALDYLTEFFRAHADKQPVALFLDDIHWADESSLASVTHLHQGLFEDPVIMIALTRPSFFQRHSTWGDPGTQLRLNLQPLSSQESEELIRRVLQYLVDIPVSLRDLIVQNAEGNPYYLEELINLLVEDGVIVREEQGWRVIPARLGGLRVPPTLTGVIQSRLDVLPRAERTVLQQASVVGRVFWDSAVSYISGGRASGQDPPEGGSEELHQILGRLKDRGLILQRGTSAFSTASEYAFNHAILREVTYESVLLVNRREYHGQVADWLISLSGDQTEVSAGLIAGHLEKAGRNEQALEYLCQAADAAAENYALEEAMDFYSRALALTPEEDLERRYSLLLGSEKVLGMRGDRAPQKEALDSLAEIAEQLYVLEKMGEVLIRKAWFYYYLSAYDDLRTAAQNAISLAGENGDPRLASQGYYIWAWADLQQGNPARAIEHARSALRYARQSGDRRAEGNSLNILGMISIAHVDFYAALQYSEEFLAVARELGDQEREITALNNVGVGFTLLGNYRAARNYFQQILELARASGDRLSEGTALVNLAWVASARSDWARARDYAEAGLVFKRQVNQVEAIAEGLIWLGHARLGLGEPKKALAAYRESLEIRQKLDQPHLAMGVKAGMARAEEAKGDLLAAQRYVSEILAYLEAGGSLEGTWEPLRIYLTCIQILQRLVDPRTAKILEDAIQILQERASRIPEGEARRQFLENVPWHRELIYLWDAHLS